MMEVELVVGWVKVILVPRQSLEIDTVLGVRISLCVETTGHRSSLCDVVGRKGGDLWLGGSCIKVESRMSPWRLS